MFIDLWSLSKMNEALDKRFSVPWFSSLMMILNDKN